MILIHSFKAKERKEKILFVGEKKCPQCNKTKNLSSFRKGRYPGGLASWCKICENRKCSNPSRKRIKGRDSCKFLADTYVRRLITTVYKIPHESITKKLIELYRAKLKYKRALLQRRKETRNV